MRQSVKEDSQAQRREEMSYLEKNYLYLLWICP